MLEKVLDALNYLFAFTFAVEFVLKIIGLGIVRYFSSCWNCLDALIVVVSTAVFQYPLQEVFITSYTKICRFPPYLSARTMHGDHLI